MDVFRLDPVTFLPDVLIESLHSKIWTERYQDPGDFEFKSSDVENTMAMLPEGSFVSLKDSDEIMMVDTLSIEEDGDGRVLVIKGSSFEDFLRHRVFSGAPYGKKTAMLRKYTQADYILVYLWSMVANTLGVSVITKGRAKYSLANQLPNVRITDASRYVGKAKTRYVENSTAYDFVKKSITGTGFGVRTIRPAEGAPSRKTVSVTSKGVITKPLKSELKASIELFEGYDRTIGQTARTPVVFSERADHVEKPTYLLSSKDYKSVAVVISGSGPKNGKEFARLVPEDMTAPRDNNVDYDPFSPVLDEDSLDEYTFEDPPVPDMEDDDLLYLNKIAPPFPKGKSGFNRKVALVDAGSKDSGESTKSFLATLDDVGRAALKNEFARVTSFDGTISPNTPYKYGVDYYLGDKVTLQGQYGILQDMQVQEYIRSEDAEGEKGFPGLTLWA